MKNVSLKKLYSSIKEILDFRVLRVGYPLISGLGYTAPKFLKSGSLIFHYRNWFVNFVPFAPR